MRIVITDSGLGGLSVVAELEKRLKENPIYENAELIFFNSLYSPEYGYNSLKDFIAKVRIFNNALNSIEQNYSPDLILIACNTLSVVYPHTEFSQNSKIAVKGILESGVALFKNRIQNDDDKIILFGTPTTINSDVYKNELINLGIKETQIVNQSCPDLESEIQRNPFSYKTDNSISNFVKEAAELFNDVPQKIFAGFCCTHYGYSEQTFLNKLEKQFNCEIEILNPNSKILDFLFVSPPKLYNDSNVTVRVVTQVKLKVNEIKSLSDILVNGSSKTATAIGDYEYIKNIFAKRK